LILLRLTFIQTISVRPGMKTTVDRRMPGPHKAYKKEADMKSIAVVLAVLFLAGIAHGAGDIHTEAIGYEHEGKALEGFLAYDKAIEGKRPGVLVIHEWRGLNDYARDRASQLAEMGFVAFALDMYGKGVLAKTSEEAAGLAGGFYGDRGLMRRRANAGLEILKDQEITDIDRLAVIGFCFGGTTALELAMSGADLDGVVAFHAGLSFPDTSGLKDIEGSVLILHGGRDPHVPQEDLTGLWEGMETAGVDYQINIYGGAVHSFTNPASGTDPSRGAAYDEKAATRSWAEMRMLFEDIF
jgi:dienelactone hydrolase